MAVRTRFAPSPTGYMHIGNLRTAIFEYLIAKKDNGKFILRIEDTDQERKVEGAIDFIYKTLELCNFKIDEGPNNPGEYGPYIQSERKELYKEYAMKLVESGHAYMCFCTEEELERQRHAAELRRVPFMYNGKCSILTKEEIEENLAKGLPYVIRQKMPKEGVTEVNDLVYGKIKIDNSILEDQILLKSDGFPTYNFANVVDDHLMGITHVIRGHEYLDQTAKYNLLYQAFGWEPPQYIHVAMVLGSDGNKLSKRNGDASFMDLYNEGYLPEAIVNYLVLLGWSPTTNQEIFTMDELIKEFDAKRISKSSSQYDVKKLNWVNAQYIKKLNDEEYVKFIRPYLESAYDLSGRSEEWINKLLITYKNHISYGKEIATVTAPFFTSVSKINEECEEFLHSDESIKNTLKVFKEKLEKLSDFTSESLNNLINEVKDESGAKGKLLYMPIRIAATHEMHGPELADTLYLTGKDKILERISEVYENL